MMGLVSKDAMCHHEFNSFCFLEKKILLNAFCALFQNRLMDEVHAK